MLLGPPAPDLSWGRRWGFHSFAEKDLVWDRPRLCFSWQAAAHPSRTSLLAA
jgi:hypothetical protein